MFFAGFEVNDGHFREHYQAIGKTGVVKAPVSYPPTVSYYNYAITVLDRKLVINPPATLAFLAFFHRYPPFPVKG
jgi:hypothetical protein